MRCDGVLADLRQLLQAPQHGRLEPSMKPRKPPFTPITFTRQSTVKVGAVGFFKVWVILSLILVNRLNTLQQRALNLGTAY